MTDELMQRIHAGIIKMDETLPHWLTLKERLIKSYRYLHEYGVENFRMSFSGGKDSCVMSYLIDLAIPDNKISRVYVDTGIELNMVKNFVKEMQKKDDRIVIIKSLVPIKQMLEEEGYPFKSKKHSSYVDIFQRNGWTKTAQSYLFPAKKQKYYGCPKILRYQFEKGIKLRISDKCCKRLKEDPLTIWQKENNKPYSIIGIMRSEGGRRNRAQCLAFRGNELKAFQPLAPVTKKWEDWFINEFNIPICDIYKPPYNFERTGCKGCPFAINIQNELETLAKYFPNEYKQCENIWKPVYDEYRRIGYRLKKSPEQIVEEAQMRQMVLEEITK